MAKILIAYYSRKGENYFGGTIKSVAKGNTEIVAEFIQKKIGGDLFEIDTVKNYPADYTECTEVAKDELRNKARPELKNYLDDISAYDTIFLGYPQWWSICPMAVFTFLEHYNFSGKKIIAFTTHEGSGFGSSIGQIKKACPTAEVIKGLAIYGSSAANSENEVARWLESLK